MQLSLFTQSLFALHLEEAIRGAAEAGYRAVELACAAPHFDIALARRAAEATASRIEETGLTVSALSLFTRFTDPETLESEVADAATFIGLAPLFNTKTVKVTPGPPSSRDATNGHWACLARAIDRLAPVAEAAGARLAFETHMRQLTDTQASSMRLLEMADKRMGLTVDFSNLSFAGDDPVAAIAAFGDRIFNTHIKNGYIDDQGNWQLRAPDEGLTDYRSVLPVLAKSGYTGYLTVECLGPDAAARPIETARRDREILARIAHDSEVDIS